MYLPASTLQCLLETNYQNYFTYIDKQAVPFDKRDQTTRTFCTPSPLYKLQLSIGYCFFSSMNSCALQNLHLMIFTFWQTKQRCDVYKDHNCSPTSSPLYITPIFLAQNKFNKSSRVCPMFPLFIKLP
jgi:hypothetical protein